YAATVNLTDVSFKDEKSGKDTQVVPHENMRWSLLETVKLDNDRLSSLDTAKEDTKTDDRDSQVTATALRQQIGAKNMRVEVVSKIVMDFTGLRAQLGTFETQIRTLVDQLSGKTAPTNDAEKDPIKKLFSTLSNAILALVKTWEGTIAIKKSRLNL